MALRTIITGTGCYVPQQKVTNEAFLGHSFYLDSGDLLDSPNATVIEKFESITGIRERRYVDDDLVTSDIAAIAARRAIEDAGIDPETLDMIVVAQNFGNIQKNTLQTDQLPGIACVVKQELGIQKPECVAYDLIFGCPGWVQGVIQCHGFMQAGMARRCLVIGAETISRIVDPHDRDTMIFADGAGAVILEAQEAGADQGLLSHATRSYCLEEARYIYFGTSNHQNGNSRDLFIKMHGRKVYEFALKYVPDAIKATLDTAGIDISEVQKIFIHQANAKMDHAIVKRLFRLYGHRDFDEEVLPMNIHTFGNSSVATVPTLLDLVRREQLNEHSLSEGDVVVFASVGAGMHINSVVYRF